MRLGLYTFASLAFIGLVIGFVYTLAPGNYVMEVLGQNLDLPVALWVAVPLLLLLLLTLLHFFYHGTRNYFVRRKWQRDADTMQDALFWSMIHEPKTLRYTIPRIREGAELLASSTLKVLELPEGVSSKLSKTAKWIQQVQNGEVVDLKEKKVEHLLSKENPLLIQNQLNRLEKDPEYADAILRAESEYAPVCVDVALQQALRKDTFFKLKKFADRFSFADLTVLLDRADAGEDVGLTQENLEAFLEPLDLDCAQYMRLVRSTITAFGPDENLAWFKQRVSQSSRAEAAYLFLLFRYEMIDKAEHLLEEHEEDEFTAFRAFLVLKKNKYSYKVRDFITAENACR